jgi:hypothetical protein
MVKSREQTDVKHLQLQHFRRNLHWQKGDHRVLGSAM